MSYFHYEHRIILKSSLTTLLFQSLYIYYKYYTFGFISITLPFLILFHVCYPPYSLAFYAFFWSNYFLLFHYCPYSPCQVVTCLHQLVSYSFTILFLLKNPPAKIPGLGRLLGDTNSNPLQYFCLEKSHGQRNMAVYSLCGHKRMKHD